MEANFRRQWVDRYGSFVLLFALIVFSLRLGHYFFSTPFAVLALMGHQWIERRGVETGRWSEPSHRQTLLMGMVLAIFFLQHAWLTESMVKLNGGLGFDGVNYGSLYELMKIGETQLPLGAPFNLRVGQPWLAGVLPLEPRRAFIATHAIFWLGAVYFFMKTCLAIHARSHGLIMLALVWVGAHWISVPRATTAYSFTVDSSLLFFSSVISYLIVTKRVGFYLLLTCAVGVVFKETVLLWVLCLTVGYLMVTENSQILKNKTVYHLCGILAVSVCAQLWVGGLFPVDGGGKIEVILMWWNERSADPAAILRYVAAALNALGPFILLGIIKIFFSRSKSYISEEFTSRWLLLATVLYVMICYVAGSDMTKFIFLSFPFLLPVIISEGTNSREKFEESRTFWVLWALILGCLVFAHIGQPIQTPEPGRETPNQDYAGPYAWMMEYAHLAWVAITLIWSAVVLAVGAGVWCKFHGKQAAGKVD